MIAILNQAKRLSIEARQYAIGRARAVDRWLAESTIRNAQDAARVSLSRRAAHDASRTATHERSQGAA